MGNTTSSVPDSHIWIRRIKYTSFATINNSTLVAQLIYNATNYPNSWTNYSYLPGSQPSVGRTGRRSALEVREQEEGAEPLNIVRGAEALRRPESARAGRGLSGYFAGGRKLAF